jgi:hypothetical protein
MCLPILLEQKENIVHLLFRRQGGVVGQFELWQRRMVMDDAAIRLECAKLAAQLAKDQKAALELARELYAFVTDAKAGREIADVP